MPFFFFKIILCTLHCHSSLPRSDHPQHAVCLPDEDQEGVVVLCSHAPPAGSALVSSAPRPPDHQLSVCGADGRGGGSLPPLKPLCAVSPGQSSPLRAVSVWGNHIYQVLSWLVGESRGLGQAKKTSRADVYVLVSLSLPKKRNVKRKMLILKERVRETHLSPSVIY